MRIQLGVRVWLGNKSMIWEEVYGLELKTWLEDKNMAWV